MEQRSVPGGGPQGDENKADTFFVAPPTVNLPKGGGAIRGIGEKFAANPVTGTGSMSVPIATSPGRSGFGPQLSLSYDSGSGNGPFGFGWSLSLPSITRKTDKGLPTYQDAEESDEFILSGAEDLVPVFKKDDKGDWLLDEEGNPIIDDVGRDRYTVRRYRPRIEGLFARIERWTDESTSEVHWRSISRDNITTLYGKTDESRIADPSDPTRVFSWLICESYDYKGNAIVYEYERENSSGIDVAQAHEANRTEESRSANCYLKRIKYGNRKPNRDDKWKATDPAELEDWMFEVVFDYLSEEKNQEVDGQHYTQHVPDAEGRIFVTNAETDERKTWDVRQDPFSTYRAGFEVRTYRLCQRVLIFHHFPAELKIDDCLVRSTEFTYQKSRVATFITAVTQSGYTYQPDEDRYLKKSLPPLVFTYSQVPTPEDLAQQPVQEVDARSLENLPIGLDGSIYQWVDLDGEGLSGILTEQAGAWFYKRNMSPLPPTPANRDKAPIARFAPLELVGATPSLADLRAGQQLLDLAGDGQIDLVQFKPPLSGYYERTPEGSWDRFVPFASMPNLAWDDPNLKFVDLTGDGHADILISEDEAFTWYASLAEAGFGSAEEIRQALDEEEGPRLVFADGTQSIYLADISGDGLSDLARIRNGAVCYWPNLGYGRFGAKVTMDDSPWFDLPDQFDQRRIRLADIDGSGTTDILYLGHDGVHIYFNHSGNSWSEQCLLPQFPPIDNLATVQALDLLGNGTACLVWSSPLPGNGHSPVYYIDLIGGQKPHLLIKTVNNLGAETHISYASSTRFYLEDKDAGKRWITRIPFPVHVVERVDTYDCISGNRFTTRYTYHHGYFDGVEREFRGFGMVEQLDTEYFAEGASQSPPPKYAIGQVATYLNQDGWQFSFRPIIGIRPSLYASGGWFYFFEGISSGIPEADVVLLEEAEEQASRYIWDGTSEEESVVRTVDVPATATNFDATSHVPPVLTRTWFHTGAYIEGGRISKQFEQEYYREGDASRGEAGLTIPQLEAMLLEDTVLPTTIRLPNGTRNPCYLSADETREACRSLKGAILRQEIYGLDDTDEANRPYRVSERNYTIEVTQPQGQNRHAVFFAHARETVDFYYERKLFLVANGVLVDPESPPDDARDAADPRVAHSLTLDVDSYGNVLQSVAVGYGRRFQDPAFTPNDLKKQKDKLVTYTENTYTYAILDADDYRTPLLCDTCTYEIVNLELDRLPLEILPDITNLFRFDEVASQIQTAKDHELPYEDFDHAQVTGSDPHRRPIEHVRTLYRANDLAALLLLRQMQSMALPGESYKLAFTPNLVTTTYVSSDKLQPADENRVFGTEGGYVHSQGDTNWWLPSGRIFYDDDANIADPSITAAQELDKARRHFFLPRMFADPFGQASKVDYDQPHDLLITRTEDALDNTIRVLNDYRVLQPSLVTDPNGNRSEVAFDALGLVAGTALMGKENEPDGKPKGDLLDGFEPDLTEAQIDAFMAKPREPGSSSSESAAAQIAHDLLVKATTRIVYDLDRFQRLGEPPFAATIARETHVSDLADDQTSKLQINFSYSDGFGREIQKKIQAEPGLVPRRGADRKIIVDQDGQPDMTDHNVSPRWVGSGWTIFNNKGKPVRQFEPFFTDTHRLEFDVKIGVSPTLFYDPAERVVATLHPNHTYEKVVFDPWKQTTWDVNDTVTLDPSADDNVKTFFLDNQGRDRLPKAEYSPTWHEKRKDGSMGPQEQDAASRASRHAGTPTIAHLDSLGRPFLTFAHNRFEQNGNIVDKKYPTRVKLDIEGNQREVEDARGLVVMRYDYDMLSNRIHQASMDAGERWMLNDVTNKLIRRWDSRGFERRMTYDALRRPAKLYVDDRLVEQTIYGEGYSEGQTNDVALNLRTRVFKQCDGAGVVTNLHRNPDTNRDEAYDFKGNLLHSVRQITVDYTNPPDWANAQVEPEKFVTCARFDALNRPIAITSPDGSIYRPIFNEANLLDKVDVNLHGAGAATSFVTNIDYNAKGQREFIKYGNGAQTEYKYDWFTYRLIHLRTTRGQSDAKDCTPQIEPRTCEDPPATCGRLQNNCCVLQDLHYFYDPVGNITYIRDDAQQIIYFKNRRVEPSADYTYDAIYRLIKATGCEHLGQAGGAPIPHSDSDAPRVGLEHPGDGRAMGTYTEYYAYDSVGNILSMRHRGTNPEHPGWKRCYQYAVDSNRLLSTSNPKDRHNPDDPCPSDAASPVYAEKYVYDAHGNMIRIPHMYLMLWDYRDQLLATSRQAVNDGQGETTYYTYDANGQRVRKVTVKPQTQQELDNGDAPKPIKERIYLGRFETYRECNGANRAAKLERETLHIMDDKQCIALVETHTLGNDGSPSPFICYQFGNHLGSASLELDEQAQIISYEEYTPYGSTSYHAVRKDVEVPLKRYRYTGKGRDEESGLYYYGARYYAPWLGRWISTDPAGVKAGINIFGFVSNNPIEYTDPLGLSQFIGITGGGLSQALGTEDPKNPDVPHIYGESVESLIQHEKEEIPAEARVYANADLLEQFKKGQYRPKSEEQWKKDVDEYAKEYEKLLRENYVPSEGVMVIGQYAKELSPEMKTKIFSPGQADAVVESILKDYTENELVMLMGHSAGGGDVQDIAQKLLARGVTNVVTIQIDSVEPFGDDATVPENVSLAINVFQEQSTGLIGSTFVRGESKLEPSSEMTRIVNQRFDHEFKGPATKIGSSSNYLPHQNIDNDPVVQQFIKEQIKETLVRDIVDNLVPPVLLKQLLQRSEWQRM